jgi:hypothetical protein
MQDNAVVLVKREEADGEHINDLFAQGARVICVYNAEEEVAGLLSV